MSDRDEGFREIYGRHMFLDKAGQPISSDEVMRRRFGPDRKISDYARIGLDEFDGVQVSTVWLGMDHQFDPDGPPLIFETMVFGGPLADYQWRYTTEAEAIAGHAQVVAKVHDFLDDQSVRDSEVSDPAGRIPWEQAKRDLGLE